MRINTLRAALLFSTALALAAPTGAALAQQAPPDTIRFATASLSPGFGQPEQGTASPSVYSLWPLYDSLTMVDTKGEVSGLLAESWKSIDKDTWQVTLKKGMKFQNGREMKAADVAAQFTYVINSPDAAGTVANSTNKNQALIATARALDDYTVEFKMASPNPELPRQLAGFWMPDDKARTELGKNEFWKNPVGTGPYGKPNYQGGTDGKIDFTSFDGGPRKPKVKNLQVVALGEAASRVAALVSNQTDIIQGPPLDAKGQIDLAGHRIDVADRPSVLGWRIISVRDTPFKDKRVRQAANIAIDRASMAKDLLGGTVIPSSQCATKNTFGYNPDVKPYAYDPALAKKLLADAGYPNGFETEVQVITGSFPADNEVYQFAAANLTAVGIRTKVSLITFTQWLDMWFGRKTGPGDTIGFSDIFSNACHNFNAIPFDAYPNMTCKKTSFPHHCDKDETALLDRAMGEFDIEKRRALIQELMVVNKDQAQNIHFFEMTDLTGLNKRVEGFSNVIQRFSFHDITLKR